MGPKGVEPLPSRLKGGSAAVTPRPQVWSGRMRLSRSAGVMWPLLWFKLSGVESNHRRRRIRSLCFRYNTGQPGRRESNPRSRAPKAREAPFLFLPMFWFCFSSSCGNRTHLSALKGQYPEPIDERAVFLPQRARRAQWVGRRSNPRLRLFRPPLNRLSYRPSRLLLGSRDSP